MNVAYLACGGWIASAVGAVAELGIADLLEAGPMTVEEIAAATSTHPRVLRPVLRALAMLDVFVEAENGRFGNTDDARDLLTSHPHSVRWFCVLSAGLYQRAFGDLLHALRTGEPASWRSFGGSIYAHLERDPAQAEVYDRAMVDLSRTVGPALAAGRDFSGVASVMDIGGGRGTLAKALLQAHPHLRAVVVDRESATRRAAAELASSNPGLGARLEFRAGDFFQPLPGAADLYLLKNVLHNWNDDDARAILARVREAMAGARTTSTLLVIEAARQGGMPGRYQRLDDLMQVVVCEPGAVARTESDLRALVGSAGLDVTRVWTLATGQTVVEATAPGAL